VVFALVPAPVFLTGPGPPSSGAISCEEFCFKFCLAAERQTSGISVSICVGDRPLLSSVLLSSVLLSSVLLSSVPFSGFRFQVSGFCFLFSVVAPSLVCDASIVHRIPF